VTLVIVGDTTPWTLFVPFPTICIAWVPVSASGVIVVDVPFPAFSVVQKEALATRLELAPSRRRPLAASVTGLWSKRGVFAGAT
jgi:hypothetical protein